jgi:hypothetical protein
MGYGYKYITGTGTSRYISGDSMSSLLWFLHGANILLPSVADPDPGSGAFLPPDPGSGSGMEQWSDPGSGIKHPGSATLLLPNLGMW